MSLPVVPAPPPQLDARRRYWHALRDVGPLVQIGGGWGLHVPEGDHIDAILRDPETFSPYREPLNGAHRSLGADAASHAQWRRVLAPLFSPRSITEMTPALRAHAAELIDNVRPRGAADVMTAVAAPFAARALATLFEFDHDKAAAFAELVGLLRPEVALLAPRDIPERLRAAGDAAAASMCRRTGAPHEQLLPFWPMLAAAGVQPTGAAAGLALLHLARHPRLGVLLRDDPSQVPAFVEEVLRLDSPTALGAVVRVATRDVDVAGFTVPAGAEIKAAIMPSNLEFGLEVDVGDDGRVIAHPHLTLGRGPNWCIGAALARTAIELLVTEWLEKIPQSALGAGCVPLAVSRRGQAPKLPLHWP